MVAGQHFEGDGDAVGSAVGAEGVPHGAVHGVVHHVQAGERDERHGPAAQLHREVPVSRRGHPELGTAACEAAGRRWEGGPGRPQERPAVPGPCSRQRRSLRRDGAGKRRAAPAGSGRGSREAARAGRRLRKQAPDSVRRAAGATNRSPRCSSRTSQECPRDDVTVRQPVSRRRKRGGRAAGQWQGRGRCPPVPRAALGEGASVRVRWGCASQARPAPAAAGPGRAGGSGGGSGELRPWRPTRTRR